MSGGIYPGPGGQLLYGDGKPVEGPRMKESPRCPKCEAEGVIECADEVDIGVGVQKHVFGYECEHCGQIAVCNGCGKLDFQGCAPWCPTIFSKP